jgi:Holliday junction resolvase RusA-like endonuclease
MTRRRTTKKTSRPEPGPPVRFSVPGQPVSWMRAGKHGKTHFTQEPHKSQREVVIWAWRLTRAPIFPSDWPLTFSGRFWFARPADHYSKVTGELKDWAVHMRPMGQRKGGVGTDQDLDNLIKLAKDALNKIAYGDDRQIVEYRPTPEKLYLPNHMEKPRSDFILAPARGWPLPSKA